MPKVNKVTVQETTLEIQWKKSVVGPGPVVNSDGKLSNGIDGNLLLAHRNATIDIRLKVATRMFSPVLTVFKCMTVDSLTIDDKSLKKDM